MLGLCRYACYYLTRNSLTYTAPVMVSDPSLKMDITQVLVSAKTALLSDDWESVFLVPVVAHG